tara:strand:- start:9496 stop:10071 length:576 start_codon:yes stop_codon:yes gene_type:complete
MKISYKKYFKKSSIYKITINGKIYVGSTLDTYGRMKHHINRLKNNKHGNHYLQNAYNKYCEFLFEIVEEYDERPTVEWLLDREKYFMLEMLPEYNLTKDPVAPSEEDRKRISDGVKKAYAEGRLINPWSLSGQSIDIYSLDGKLLHKDTLVKDAIDIVGVSNRSVINAALRNNRYRVKNNLVCRTGESIII